MEGAGWRGGPMREARDKEEKVCGCQHNKLAVEIDIAYHEPESFMNTNVPIHDRNKLD